jgi:hypothetical protein
MSRTKTIAVGAICAVAATGTTATAASLITSAKIADGTIMNRDIHRGTISESRLDRGVVAKLNRLAVPGPAGARGATGASGATGATGAPGADGQVAGVASQVGLNPATTVKASEDAGWKLTGTSPTAKLASGELRLAGGFDGADSNPAGGLGIAKLYGPFDKAANTVSLSSLSALSFSAHIIKRPNTVSAPTIHVTLVGAETGTPSGFTNLVYEPANNGGMDVGKPYSVDAYSGQWWSTKTLTGHPSQITASLTSFIDDNPNAKIFSISVDNGGSSTNTVPADEFAAGVDNLIVGFGNKFDRYDFGG